jgi:archaellum component FlaC
MNGEGEIVKALLTLHEAAEMHFNAVDARFDAMDTRLNGVDTRLNAVDTRLNAVDRRLNAVDTRLDRLERNVRIGFDDVRGEMRAGFADLKETLDHLGRRRGSR